MRELNVNDIKDVNGGMLPAIWVIAETVAWAAARYGAGRLAAGAAGAAAGWFE